MTISEIADKKTWDDFFETNHSPSFLQSWEWGNLQKQLGYRIKRLGLSEKNRLVAIMLVMAIKSKRGNFLFVPHGPIIKVKNDKLKVKSYLEALKSYLIDCAKKEHSAFIRIAPVLEDSPEYRQLFAELGFKKSPIYMHAERVWLLALDKSEEQLLAEMRKTTRYSIRKAERDVVVIEKRTDSKTVDDFYNIYEKTADRENFVPFSKDFIRKEFSTFSNTGNSVFLFGAVPTIHSTPEVEKNYVASALIIFTKSTAFYHQGASIHTKIPVTSLLQWEAIKEAKRRGCKFYNFWGTLQEGRTPKNWAGLTLFKQGFGGGQVDYVPTQDFVLSPAYYFTYLYEQYLKWRRGI